MAPSTSTLTFPHPKLTPIVGTPTNSGIKQLTKEIYTNARAIPSTRGGGGHGHLGLVMPVAEYMVITGVAFQLPAHPGQAPIHAPNATQFQIAETVRLFDAMLAELTTATTAREEMKKQLLEAVERLFLAALDDDTFGFADVSVAAMITHLRTTYGPITRADLELNCASIGTVWTPDEPIETLWEKLRKIQCLSVAGGDPLTDNAIKDLAFLMFEATGVFTTACDMWRVRPPGNQTLVEFRQHFTTENKERVCKLTTSQLGYHIANLAISDAPVATPPAAPAGSGGQHSAHAAIGCPVVTNNPGHHIMADNGIPMFYCWTHGLGFNRTHTSATCANPGDGHISNATATNMQGGKNTIQAHGYCRRAEHPPPKA